LPPGHPHQWHQACARRLFGAGVIPTFDLDFEHLAEAGLVLLGAGKGIPGVQTKLSVDRDATNPRRLTVVGMAGRLIVKPPAAEYPYLPENEAFCMELAGRLGLPAAAHGLVYGPDGRLHYLSRRFDRPDDGTKLPQEDFCQINQRPAADKYKGSLEAAARALEHSAQAGLDRVRYLELNLFAWLSGNADMHLKNFSLFAPRPGQWEMSPAYDLVSTALVLPEDREECALTLKGKKSRLNRADWLALAVHLGIPEKVFGRLVERLAGKSPLVTRLCRASFLPERLQDAFLELWTARLELLTAAS
jgi:serine/threonine-protein kinase HipA